MADNKNRSIVDHYQPDSPIGTEFLRLYHHLKRTNESQEGAPSYLITSATMGEGKSTAASFLAMTLGAIKKKTLLIDGDLRRPAIHSLFNLYLEDGVTDVADGAIEQARAYKETRFAHLYVLTAGRLTKSPSPYYQDGHMGRIVEQARPHFEYVVIDCAPVMPVVDALALAPSVSGVLIVVKAGETNRDLVKQATDILVNAKAPVKGVLLNNLKGVLPPHYSYRYSYEYYNTTANDVD